MQTVSPPLRVGIVQTHLAWHQPETNRSHFDQLLANAPAADLLILPEMFTTGFTMQPQQVAEGERDNNPTFLWLQEKARALDCAITGSLVVQASDGSYRNRLLWVTPDGSSRFYDKRHLFRMAGEHEHYQAGDQPLLLSWKGWRIRPLICYDLRFPVWSRDPHSTDLLLYIANWPTKRRHHWNRLLPARAIENLCYVAGVNRIGQDHNGHAYSGDSIIVDYEGNALCETGDQEGVFISQLSHEALHQYRSTFPAFQDADHFTLGSA